MKIIERFSAGVPVFSLEFFPPKTQPNENRLLYFHNPGKILSDYVQNVSQDRPICVSSHGAFNIDGYFDDL